MFGNIFRMTIISQVIKSISWMSFRFCNTSSYNKHEQRSTFSRHGPLPVLVSDLISRFTRRDHDYYIRELSNWDCLLVLTNSITGKQCIFKVSSLATGDISLIMNEQGRIETSVS